MRFIDPQDIPACAPTTWAVNVVEWNNKISTAQADKRSAEFTKIGNKWSDFKVKFIDKYGDKCWFTETPRIGTDFDVDHYRPKGRVRLEDGSLAIDGNGESHEGYWWLAFSPLNYRYCCIFSNRPRAEEGKWDYFPLTDESKRAWSQNDSTQYEQPMLLDPCNVDDVSLITYQADGEPLPRYSQTQDKISFARAEFSIKKYNFREKSVRSGRLIIKKQVDSALEILRILHKVKKLSAEDASAKTKACDVLKSACDRKAPFSAFSVSLVVAKKAQPWMQALLPQLDLTP